MEGESYPVVVSDPGQRPVCCLCGGTPSISCLGSAPPQSKTLEELSEIYASAADAQEIAATSSDPVLARERLQSVLRDIAGAASFPAITGEKPLRAPLSSTVFCRLNPLQQRQAVLHKVST